MSNASPTIECRGVWKVYGQRAETLLRGVNGTAPSNDEFAAANCIVAARDVSLSVFDGEILVIMGLSGSGKSTLLRCLCRLVEPSRGEIFIEGDSILDADRKQLIELRRRKIGMVFQHFGLLPHRTVLENVMLPLELQGIGRHQQLERARSMIELVGLRGRDGYYPSELSGGQQQRVGIARSLAADPHIWLLDEPFSALDPLIRREMQDEFLRLQRQLGKTIVFVTHDFDEAIRVADRIAIMKDGSLVQVASPEELVLSPATDYVAQFTRDAVRGRLVTARHVVADAQGEASPPARTVAADARLYDIARSVMADDAPVGVVDQAGHLLGLVDRRQLLDNLVDQQSARQ